MIRLATEVVDRLYCIRREEKRKEEEERRDEKRREEEKKRKSYDRVPNDVERRKSVGCPSRSNA